MPPVFPSMPVFFSLRGLTKSPHKESGANLKHLGTGRECQARTRNEVRVPAANWGTHYRSCPDWKHQPMVRMPGPDLNEVRVGTHKRSCPDWKHQPMVRMPGPDLNEVRVQHLTRFQVITANPNIVRVPLRPLR